MKFESYRKKPLVVQAAKVDNMDDLREFLRKKDDELLLAAGDGIYRIIRGELVIAEVTYGDYLVFGVDGSIYPVKPDVFHRVYEQCSSSDEIVW